jgi:cysteine desulfurase/selenocysteine lyase
MTSPLDINKIRSDFPILATHLSGKPLIYLDNGASTQKPQAVIDAICDYYRSDNANIHRGVYELSQRATDRYEAARVQVARFLEVSDPAECIFTRGTTESINLVAECWGRSRLVAGDEILITALEHHSNIVPWQMACQATGAKLRVVVPDAQGVIDLSAFRESLSAKTRLVAVQQTSNALGVVHDVASMVQLARSVGALVLVDGAQSVAHQPTDLAKLNCDFFAFSGHKLYGPTGIGVLWGRRELLESLPPYMGGGDMIETVAFSGSTYAGLPNRFEAGTPHISGAIGLAASIGYIQSVGFEAIAAQEQLLLKHLTERLDKISGVRIIGRASHKAAIVSFVVESPNMAPIDVATALGLEGIAIRTGHHCCMPLMKLLGVAGTCRASLAFYNTLQEVDRFAEVLERIVQSRREQLAVGQQPSQTNTVDQHGESMCDRAQSFFAQAAGESPDVLAEELEEEFALCDDPKSKTQFLLELGQQLPDAFGSLKKISTSVPGCMSEVYLIGRPANSGQGRIEFAGDSNAQIVRGLIALLQRLLSGQPASAVMEFDVEGFFRRIGLEQFITSQRRSGLAGMVQRIRQLAKNQIPPPIN